MTAPRYEVIRPGTGGTYHCISRCVRRAFLCGFDRLSGKSYDHRKDWLLERIKFLVTVFTIETLAYALMCDHFHLLLRALRDNALELSDREVLRRWLLLYPLRREDDGTPCEPSDLEIDSRITDKKYIGEIRERLCSVSWFMKSLNEYIARRANAEDRCRGHFWEGRFKSQRVDGDGSILACMTYIDLNPIRAGMARTPEESIYTSAWERIGALAAQTAIEKQSHDSGATTTDRHLLSQSKLGSWLVPFSGQAEFDPKALPFSLNEYLTILDWTGRQRRPGKRGAIPSDLAPILLRLQLNPASWCDVQDRYNKLFHRVVARADEMSRAAASAGKKWFKGISAARSVFVSPQPA